MALMNLLRFDSEVLLHALRVLLCESEIVALAFKATQQFWILLGDCASEHFFSRPELEKMAVTQAQHQLHRSMSGYWPWLHAAHSTLHEVMADCKYFDSRNCDIQYSQNPVSEIKNA